jgi:hypothetical protein
MRIDQLIDAHDSEPLASKTDLALVTSNSDAAAKANTTASSQGLKRQASPTPLPEESPAKKPSQWTLDEDKFVIMLRDKGTIWKDIAKQLPGRSDISCRLHYQNYLVKWVDWNEAEMNKLATYCARHVCNTPRSVDGPSNKLCARLAHNCSSLLAPTTLRGQIIPVYWMLNYCRLKAEMLRTAANEIDIPLRLAELMFWKLEERERSASAPAVVSQPHLSEKSAGLGSPSQILVEVAPSSQMPLQHQTLSPPPQSPLHSYKEQREKGTLDRQQAKGRPPKASVPLQSKASVPIQPKASVPL